MSLLLEIPSGQLSGWIEIGRVETGDPPGSISNHTEDGTREIYLFACLSNEKSVLYRSNFGLDQDITTSIRLTDLDLSQLEVITELGPGEALEMTVKTDRSPTRRRIRFRHERPRV